MRKELLKGLSEEQIKKIEACKSSEEMLNLAKAEGIELTDEQLEAVSGGCAVKSRKRDKRKFESWKRDGIFVAFYILNEYIYVKG